MSSQNTDSGLEVVEQSSPSCCRLSNWVTPLLLGVTISSLALAAFFAGRSSRDREAMDTMAASLPAIDAVGSASSDKFSVATGFVSDEAEGFFVLDHNSGLLQCSVIYPRIGKVMSQFSGNVAENLGTGGKGGKYIMVTGQVDFPRASNRPASNCVVYVLDTATGNYACYGIPFDRVAMNANRQQTGTFVLIHQGTANPLIDRDNLR